MVCYTTCALATGFIGSSLAILFSTRQHLLNSQFINTLDNKQKTIYYAIVHERFNLYVVGAILGLILSVGFYFYSKQNDLSKRTLVCSVVVIIGLTQYLYYSLMPKTHMMLDYLTKPEQISAWLEIYKYMKRQCHMGFLIGLVGYGLLAFANI